jgi:predicted XRE-type DNA-binding protein
MNAPLTELSGNVFADLGFPLEEGAILRMRADLLVDLRKYIEKKGLTQVEAAKVLGVGQSSVSGLVRGKWRKSSLEMLITLATRAGMRVSVRLAA